MKDGQVIRNHVIMLLLKMVSESIEQNIICVCILSREIYLLAHVILWVIFIR